MSNVIKGFATKFEGKTFHDVSSFHAMVPNSSNYTVTLGNPESKHVSTITVELPSDVMVKQ